MDIVSKLWHRSVYDIIKCGDKELIKYRFKDTQLKFLFKNTIFIFLKGEDYSVISRSLFPNLNNQKIQSTINYYFDSDTQLNKRQTTQLTPQPFRLIPSSNNNINININNHQKIIGYSSPTQHSRLLKMRDINFYSIAFQLLINQHLEFRA